MTKALERVLLAIGPDDRDHLGDLFEVAETIAGSADATVYLLHVFPWEEYEDLMDQFDIKQATGNLQPDELAARYENVRMPASAFEAHDIDYEVRGTIGDPETEVVRMAGELNADLLIIGGTARSPAGKAVFGDQSQQILLNAPCPVTYVRRDE